MGGGGYVGAARLSLPSHLHACFHTLPMVCDTPCPPTPACLWARAAPPRQDAHTQKRGWQLPPCRVKKPRACFFLSRDTPSPLHTHQLDTAYPPSPPMSTGRGACMSDRKMRRGCVHGRENVKTCAHAEGFLSLARARARVLLPTLPLTCAVTAWPAASRPAAARRRERGMRGAQGVFQEERHDNIRQRSEEHSRRTSHSD